MSNTVTVSTAAQLQAALASATSGETILLNTANYGALYINAQNFSASAGGLTIQAAPNSHAIVTAVDVQASSNIKISGLDVDLSGGGMQNYITTSSNITLTNMNFHGVINASNGMYITGDNGVTISNSQFSVLENGIGVANTNNTVLSNNTFSQMGVDGIDVGGAAGIVITNNTFVNFEATGQGHPDSIQFATTNTTQLSSNIVISYNTMITGSGTQFQGIFMGDSVGNLPFQNVTITGNTLSGTSSNGIIVQDGQNVSVTNNTVLGLTALGLTTLTNSYSAIQLIDVTGGSASGNNADSLTTTGSNNVSLGLNSIDGVAQTPVEYSSTSAMLGNLRTELVFTGTTSTTGAASAPGQTIVANNAGDLLYDCGLAGGDVLIGGSGNDYISASGPGDTLTGGAGSNTFAIANLTGNVTVTDFGAAGSQDHLDLRGLVSSTSHPILTNSGANTIISFSGGPETITLLGVHANQLSSTTAGLYNFV